MNLTSRFALGVVALTAFAFNHPLCAQNVYATPYTFTTIAGHPASGARDGTGTAAQFCEPVGIATDSSGNIYVADSAGHSVRKITAAGIVSTLAGGSDGSADGTGSAAQFGWLFGLTVDAAGNVYVSESTNNTIRKITPAGAVTTLAGSPDVEGSADGTGSAARFKMPGGLAADAEGNLYVADSSNHTIRKITPSGVVTTLAGSAGLEGLVDGTGSVARFSTPRSVAVDSSGNVIVIDSSNNKLRKITPAGVVSTFAGSGQFGSADGAASEASFAYPVGLAADKSGNIYVADTVNCTLRQVTSAGMVSTLAGTVWANGYIDGTGSAARFTQPQGIAVDATGNIYIADTGNQSIRKLAPGNIVTTLAGAVGSSGSADGSRTLARFNQPYDVAVSPSGIVYVADYGNRTIRKIATNGEVSLLAGVTENNRGSSDGIGGSARFAAPWGVDLDSAGNLYVADGSYVRKITAAAEVTSVSMQPYTVVNDVAVDATGNVFVADWTTYTIRKVTPSGETTLFAGATGSRGFTDGTGSAARFQWPTGIAVDATGRVYVVDGSAIRVITAAGVVTTLAGGPDAWGSRDGTGSEAQFSGGGQLAVDGSGNVFVTDAGLIRKITPSGVVTTIAGSSPGSADGTGAAARFYGSAGIAIDKAGALYVADRLNNTIRKGVPVPKTTPAISWSNPSPITYGTALSSNQLNATTSVAGTFAYTPAAGAVLAAGSQTLTVTFTPADPTIYTTATAQVSLMVQASVPAITWNPPASIIFGAALNSTQLNATASVPGTFTYSPTAGTALTIGTTRLRATFTPADVQNYTTATAEAILTVVGQDLVGAYFGTFANNHGHWALKVNRDNTAVYIAHLTSRHTAVIVHLALNADGTFTTTGTETAPLSAGSEAQGLSLTPASGAHPLVTASAFTLTGQVFSGAVTGQLTGLDETFSGTIDATSGAAPNGFFTASALNTASGSTYAVVAPSGQALVIVASTTLDSASGTVSANGQLTAATTSGGQLALTINASAQSLATTLTPSSSTTPISFAGLADTATSTTRLVNISARAYCATDDKVTIGGLVVSGSAAKRVLIRAVGPSLTAHGIGATEALADPTIEVHNASTNAIVATNDNWPADPNATNITAIAATVGASALLASDTTSAALLTSLPPGVYTFVVRGKNSTSGIVLLEVYDADSAAPTANFVNLASRAYATTGNGVAIGGFVITGNAPKRILLRALGPTLTTQGLTTAQILPNPIIELHHGSDPVITNDNWGTNPNAADIRTTGARIGATPIDAADTASSALLVTLTPGVYSFIAQGQRDSSGIVLVEIYDAD